MPEGHYARIFYLFDPSTMNISLDHFIVEHSSLYHAKSTLNFHTLGRVRSLHTLFVVLEEVYLRKMYWYLVEDYRPSCMQTYSQTLHWGMLPLRPFHYHSISPWYPWAQQRTWFYGNISCITISRCCFMPRRLTRHLRFEITYECFAVSGLSIEQLCPNRLC